MLIVRNSLLPPKDFDAINLCGILFCHKDTRLSPYLLNHERIHTRQMWEMLVVPFYIWYIAEWLLRLPRKGNAYRNISFEREAYSKMMDLRYLSHRKPYAWISFLHSKT